MGNPFLSHISALTRTIDQRLDEVIDNAPTCAFLDFPDHSNVGDSAIWLGALTTINRKQVRILYSCSHQTYSEERLRASLDRDSIIFLHGGGNLGDLWPSYEIWREHVVKAFPGHKVVVLPQSAWFTHPDALSRAVVAFRRHPDITFLARDWRTQDLLTTEGLRALPCPDMAFALGALPRPAAPISEFLWLRRSDHEAVAQQTPLPAHEGVSVTDWITHPEEEFVDHVGTHVVNHLYREIIRRPRVVRALQTAHSTALLPFERMLAHSRLARGQKILGQGKVVITDRLHGHILSLLMGIPHVTLDNSYGKLAAFQQTWGEAGECHRTAQTPHEALAIAEELAAG